MFNKTFFLMAIIAALLSKVKVSWADSVLTWQDCVIIAEKNNPEFMTAREKVRQYEERIKISQSKLYPQVTADASTSLTDQGDKSTSLGLSGRQLVYDGKKTSYEIKIAEENLKAAEYDLMIISAGVRYELQKAFSGLFKAQEYLVLTEEIIKIREQSLRLVQLRYDAGREHKGSLLTSQANLAKAQFDAGHALRNLETSRYQLLNILGMDAFQNIRVKGSFEFLTDTSILPDYQKIIEENPYIWKLVSEKISAEHEVSATKADYYPDIYASVSAKRNDNSLSSNNDFSAGLSVSMPLFDGGLRKAELSSAQSAVKQKEADLNMTQNDILLSLVSSWNGLQDAISGLSVQGKYLQASEERAKIAEAQYESGLISFDTWTIIEDELVTNKKKYLDAKTDILLSEANWLYAKGVQINQ
ncbi:MAG: TolC family protein [Candidatus Aureabacteria bacterium]|nr:TolC family protein [Candidatus Auribacterota bacterium]